MKEKKMREFEKKVKQIKVKSPEDMLTKLICLHRIQENKKVEKIKNKR